MNRIILFVLFGSLIFVSAARAQERTEEQPVEQNGKLRDFGKEVEKEAKKPNDEPEKTWEEIERDRQVEDATIEFVADVLFDIFKATITAPKDTSNVPNVYHTFAQYPYFQPEQGLYKIGGAKDFSLQLRANYYRESPALMGGGVRLRVSPLTQLSGEAYITMLSERVGSRTDRMMLASFFLNYNLVRENVCAAWIGAGSKLVHGAGANENALAGNATVEVYPFDPLSFHANFSWGPYSELFTTLNYHLSRYSIYLGYQALVAGSADLHGFIIGSSLYF